MGIMAVWLEDMNTVLHTPWLLYPMLLLLAIPFTRYVMWLLFSENKEGGEDDAE